jgi:hypothetical protein
MPTSDESRVRNSAGRIDADSSVGVVHNSGPGEAAGAEQAPVEPHVAGRGMGDAVGSDVNRHVLGDDAPVERAGVERSAHRRALGRLRAFEAVVAATREGGRRQDERGDCED